jgi:pSer/pThr/pTyr-binding forkhead associated (FHA) protein
LTELLVFLKALTPEAKESLGGSYYKITRFPFRVGRESRASHRAIPMSDLRRRSDSSPNNDLYLPELGEVLNVSREHFQIERENDRFVIVDRGSACGLIVEGESVGDRRQGGRKPLENNDVIIVGTSESRFVFKFVLLESR